MISTTSTTIHPRYLAAYRDGLNATAVFVASRGPAGPTRLATARDLTAAVGRLRRSSGRSIELGATWWCVSAEQAKWLQRHVGELLRGSGLVLESEWIDASAEELRQLVETWAEGRVKLIPPDALKERAERATRAVLQELERMRITGGLAPINAQFREHRLAMAAEGKKCMPYKAWLEGHAAGLVRAAAERERVGSAFPTKPAAGRSAVRQEL